MVTGTRAEYGLLYWLLKEIQADPDLILQIIATGMHLSPEFGNTYRVIEEDGFIIDARVEMLLSSDTPVGVTKSIGLGIIGFADAFERLRPDIVVLLGDRFEILAAAQAAMVARIPIAHLHGGEATEGLIDEAIRHAVTKMAHLHFVAAEPYRKRILQMGEQPERVVIAGAIGLDNIKRLKLLSREELEQSIGFSLGTSFFLVTYHPVTLNSSGPRKAMEELLKSLDAFPDVRIVFTKPNADTDGRLICAMIDAYAALHSSRVVAVTSLGQVRYLSALAHTAMVIGNSSSGIIEAPAFHKPTINIGDRQKGRLRAGTVIDCAERSEAITAAIQYALSPVFQEQLKSATSPYGYGNASVVIKECLKRADLDGILRKSFYDMKGML